MKNALIIIFITFQLSVSQVFVEKGRFGTAGEAHGQFNEPAALSISAEEILFVVDTGNHRVQLFNLKGGFLRTIGGFGFNDHQFDRPMDIWTRTVINFYVADYNNQRIVRYDRNMNFISTLTNNEANPYEYQFAEVVSCALNSQQDLFILDRTESKVVKYDRHGGPLQSFGSYESGAGELEEPYQIDVQGTARILITDALRGSLFVFDAFGNFIVELKIPEMQQAAGLTVNNEGRIFITDSGSNRLFSVSVDFKKIVEIKLNLSEKVKTLRDVAYWKKAGRPDEPAWLYLIDDNQIVFGNLMDE